MAGVEVLSGEHGRAPRHREIRPSDELLPDDARVRELRGVERLERATRRLLARLSGMRAKDISHSELVKYAAARKSMGARPTR